MKLFRFVLLASVSSGSGVRTVDRGLNLPATQGTTRDGAFFPGLYQYDYVPEQVSQAAHRAGFSALRLAVNVETANNAKALQKHKEYIDAVGGRGIICMFDTAFTPGTSWPRNGTVTGKVEQVAKAWRSVHSVFASYGDNVLYEIFNEPWGYQNNAATYVADMLSVIQMADLPHDRVILAGLFGSADVQSVARAGWPGYLAYHTYVFWLPEGQRTQEAFSKKIQQDLAGLSSRVFITEFGVGLDGLKANVDEDELKQDVLRYVDKQSVTADWHNEHPRDLDVQDICARHPDNAWCKKRLGFMQKPVAANIGADVAAQMGLDVGATVSAPEVYQNDTMAFLRGMRDALLMLKWQGAGIRGLYHWHGWHNGDTWDFWDAANARSSRLIQMMMMDQGEVSTTNETHGNEACFNGDAKCEAWANAGQCSSNPVYMHVTCRQACNLCQVGNDRFMSDDRFMAEDFVEDGQQVHMMVARQLSPKPSGECPAECGIKHCQAGNAAQIGGKHVTGNFCTHNCSQIMGGMRYCGVGVGYQEGEAISCGGCADPPMCAGLPCWTLKAVANSAKNPSRFLQKRGRGTSPTILSA
jgi:hypothetical protein